MVAIAKRKLEVYLNMGHDIVTAKDMKASGQPKQIFNRNTETEIRLFLNKT